MGDLDYPDETWDRFFDFISPNVDEMTDEEIQSELQNAGIDITPAFERVREALKRRMEVRDAQ